MSRIGLFLSVFVFWAVSLSGASSPLRIGVDDSPPFYALKQDGTVQGFAVDVVAEAAKRSGISVVWVPITRLSLDTALDRRVVDVWPLSRSTAERRGKFYVSEPWVESDYMLVSRGEDPVRDESAARGRAIAHSRAKVISGVARQYFPQSSLLPSISRNEAVQKVCRAEASAALVESRVLDAILLDRPAGCEATAFAVAILKGVENSLCLMAVPEKRDQAIKLRQEIQRLTTEGFVSSKFDEWTPISAEGSRSFWKAKLAEERTSAYQIGFAAMLIFALALGWLTWRASVLRGAAVRAESSLREVERRFSAFMDNSPAISFMKDSEGRFVYCNKSFFDVLGGSEKEWYEKADDELFPAEIAQKLKADDQRLVRMQRPQQFIETAPSLTGEPKHWLTVKFPFTAANGTQFVGGTSIDITESETARRALAQSEEQYRKLSAQQQNTLEQLAASETRWRLALLGAGDALWDWDLMTGEVFRSPLWLKMLGYGEEEIQPDLGAWESLLHPADAPRVIRAIEAHFHRETTSYAAEYRISHKDGTWRWILDRGQAVWNTEGQPVRMAGSCTEITRRKTAEEKLATQAATDSLTGLANRRSFDQTFEKLVETTRESGESLTVCVCDLDRFKAINDTYGHPAGDIVLAGFAKTLRQNVRDLDMIWRIGGDEFVLALPNTSIEQAFRLIEKIHAEVQKLSFTEANIRFSCSFGVAEFHTRHENAGSLLSEADQSLYKAKHLGRDRVWAA